jgi:hypothetical protein
MPKPLTRIRRLTALGARPQPCEAEKLDYMRQASLAALQAYELACLNRAANIKKEIAVLVDGMVNEAAAAALARFLITNRRLQTRQIPRTLNQKAVL